MQCILWSHSRLVSGLFSLTDNHNRTQMFHCSLWSTTSSPTPQEIFLSSCILWTSEDTIAQDSCHSNRQKLLTEQGTSLSLLLCLLPPRLLQLELLPDLVAWTSCRPCHPCAPWQVTPRLIGFNQLVSGCAEMCEGTLWPESDTGTYCSRPHASWA